MTPLSCLRRWSFVLLKSFCSIEWAKALTCRIFSFVEQAGKCCACSRTGSMIMHHVPVCLWLSFSAGCLLRDQCFGKHKPCFKIEGPASFWSGVTTEVMAGPFCFWAGTQQ